MASLLTFSEESPEQESTQEINKKPSVRQAVYGLIISLFVLLSQLTIPHYLAVSLILNSYICRQHFLYI